MNERELEKKKKEVAEVDAVVDEINSQSATDYFAEASDIEPADVILRSRSGAYADRQVQVVSIPGDHEIRADNNNLERLKATLKECLAQQGVTQCFVGLT